MEPSQLSQFPFLSSDGGVTGLLFRSIDWDRHPMGPANKWPLELKITLGILFASRQPMFIFWGEDHYQFYNDAYLPSISVGKHPRAMGQRGEECWPEIWPVIHPQIRAALDGGKSSWYENQLLPIFRNGSLEDVYWTYGYSPIADEEGRIGGVIVLCVETTASVNAMNEVKSSQKDLFDFFMQAPVPMVILDGPTHMVRLANPPYEKFVGRSVAGKTLKEAFSGGEADEFIPIIDKVYRTGEPFIGSELPVQLPDKSGHLQSYWIDVGYHPFRDQNGKIRGVFAIVHDVTAQVTARDELRKSSELLQAIMTTSPDLIYVKDRNGRMVYCNPTTLRLIGKDAGEVFGKTDLEFLDDEPSARSVMATDERIMSSGNGEFAEEFVRWPDGQTRFYLSRKEPQYNNEGQVVGLIGISTDHSELRQAQERIISAKKEAEKANSLKSAFLANMSHEIRTPLGAIMGFIDLIKDQNLSRTLLDNYISVIDRNSSQLLRIIDDILDLSKVEAGMIQLENLEFSLIELLADFSSLMGFRAREKGITFETKMASSLPLTVNSDPTRIRQILSNIVGNAIKFTDSGGVDLAVSFSDGVLKFRVKDTGRGITSDQEKNLFQPFSQGDISVTRKFGGTGLGLVLTRQLAKVLGGDFKLIESREGAGSTFEATLRVSVKPGTAMTFNSSFESPKTRINSFASQLEDQKILLVEDSLDNQALISIILKKSGAIVDIASDGSEGVRAATNGSYDVVLMDVQMPVMDGITAVRRLRELGYTKPVVALTAHAMKEERDRCLKAGFSDFLSKPVQREALLGLLKNLKSSPRN